MIAIVLGAGRGTRMGMPKAELVVDGELLLVQHVRRLREIDCAEIIVAVPAAFATEACALSDARILGLDTRSQSETLASVLAAIDRDARNDTRLLITPIDLRPPRADTLRALVDSRHAAVVPRHAGRRGHPLLVERAVLRSFDGSIPLDRFLGDRRHALDVDDPLVLGDLDAPADLDGDR